jgi:hypothetical protein
MDFFINKNSTLPIMYLELIEDGRYDFTGFYNKLQDSTIYFTMSELNTGVKKIGKVETQASAKTNSYECPDCLADEYYLTYQFSERDTNKSGVFIGKFIIEFGDGSGTLIVPIRDELRINIIGGSII